MFFYNKEDTKYKLLIHLGWVALLLFISFFNKEPFYLVFGILPVYIFFKRYKHLRNRRLVFELNTSEIIFFEKSIKTIIPFEKSDIIFNFSDAKNLYVESKIDITANNKFITSFTIEHNEVYRLIDFINKNNIKVKFIDKRTNSHQKIKDNLSQELAIQTISFIVCIGFALFLFFKYEALLQPEPTISTLKGGIVRNTLKVLNELGGKIIVLSILVYIGLSSLLKIIYLKKYFNSI